MAKLFTLRVELTDKDKLDDITIELSAGVDVVRKKGLSIDVPVVQTGESFLPVKFNETDNATEWKKQKITKVYDFFVAQTNDGVNYLGASSVTEDSDKTVLLLCDWLIGNSILNITDEDGDDIVIRLSDEFGNPILIVLEGKDKHINIIVHEGGSYIKMTFVFDGQDITGPYTAEELGLLQFKV